MRGKQFKLVLAAALLTAGSVAAGAKRGPPAFPEGLFGNVELSEVTGDLGGFEVRFYTDPESHKPMAEFTLCEGWCNTVHTSEVVREGNGFAFSHEEEVTYSDGTSARQLVRYRVVPAGGRLKVSVAWQDGAFSDPWRIKRLGEPWGLDVAKAETASRAQQPDQESPVDAER